MKNLSDINVIRSVMAKHGVTFNKGLGQNFLVDPQICPSMAEYAELDKNTCVIEVGPGVGVLTAELAKRAGKVLSFELDERLLPVLAETLKEFDNVEIINQDIMKADLKTLIEEKCKGMKIAVCANLPYYITSPIIAHLLGEIDDLANKNRAVIEDIILMVQEEVAHRIVATEKSSAKQYGLLTILSQFWADCSIIRVVGRRSFYPAPKVNSALISLKVRKEPLLKLSDYTFFRRVIKAAFAQRRKTALNSISSGLGMSKADVGAAIEAAGLDINVRAEKLNMEQLALLCDELSLRR